MSPEVGVGWTAVREGGAGSSGPRGGRGRRGRRQGRPRRRRRRRGPGRGSKGNSERRSPAARCRCSRSGGGRRASRRRPAGRPRRRRWTGCTATPGPARGLRRAMGGRGDGTGLTGGFVFSVFAHEVDVLVTLFSMFEDFN